MSEATPTPSGPSTIPPEAPKAPSGWVKALEHTGIPTSWIRRPRLPSRNMMIFLTTVGTIGGAWYYDRRQCKLIKQKYIDKVKHLADEPMSTWDTPRKVTVYACKWPGDDAYDRSLTWFKKYVKPILVAAAVDYEYSNGNQHGALMKSIEEQIRTRRRIEAGIDPPPPSLPIPGPPRKDDKRERELEGGIIIVGRHTFKEYMEGLKRGWTRSLEKVDGDEALSRLLENDGHFDEPELESIRADGSDSTPVPADIPAPSPIVFSPLQLRMPPPPPPSKPSEPSIPPNLDVPPSRIPDQPPLALIPYTNLLGFRNIPFMIWGFFNQRKDVQTGAEAAYRIVAKETRPFDEPTADQPKPFEDLYTSSLSEGQGDLAFDLESENQFRSSYDDTPKDVETARKAYYKELPAKLILARSLARREREPTKAEISNPPPTEVQLRAERLKKEKKWRDQLEAWEILRKGQPVAWDERFRGVFKVFVDGEVPAPEPRAADVDQ